MVCEHRYLPPPRMICFLCCLFVCLSATLRINFWTELHEIFREGWQWADEQIIKFLWRSGSPSGYRDCFPDWSLLGHTRKRLTDINLLLILIRQMAALVRRALAEVCTAPMLLVCCSRCSRLKHFYFRSFIPSDIVFYSLYFSLAYFVVLLLGAPERRMGGAIANDWLIDSLIDWLSEWSAVLQAVRTRPVVAITHTSHIGHNGHVGGPLVVCRMVPLLAAEWRHYHTGARQAAADQLFHGWQDVSVAAFRRLYISRPDERSGAMKMRCQRPAVDQAPTPHFDWPRDTQLMMSGD